MIFGSHHVITRQVQPMHNLTSPAAPRVTPADVAANIASEHYFTADEGARENDPYEILPASLYLLTFCVLVLKNGFTVTGESACVSPANFDAGVGRRIARENAVHKVWPLMGYALKEQLHHSPTPAVLPHPLKDFYG